MGREGKGKEGEGGEGRGREGKGRERTHFMVPSVQRPEIDSAKEPGFFVASC